MSQNLGRNQIIGRDVKIADSARINVTEYLELGDRTVVNEEAIIEGRYVKIGREGWIDEHAHIGGGSCFDWQSSLKAGDFLHIGRYAHINTAREVSIGDEVGIGMNTKVFTHGAYLPAYDGFPVQFANVTIGNRVWIPNAWVNPGVVIGNNVVVAAMSLINKDLPDGCLAGGIPAKVIEENKYPREMTYSEKVAIIKRIIDDLKYKELFKDVAMVVNFSMENRGDTLLIDWELCEQVGREGHALGGGKTLFDIQNRQIKGPGNRIIERIRNQLRRYGIRFKYSLNEKGEYEAWPS